MTPWSRILRAAADLIEVRGLARGTLYDSQGRICAMEAIWRAATGCDNADRSETAVADGSTALSRFDGYRWAMITVQRHIRPDELTVARWSDAHEQADVVAGLRRIADLDEESVP